MRKFRSDKVLKSIGLYETATTIRTSTFCIDSFKRGCFVIGLTSFIGYWFFNNLRSKRELFESKGYHELSKYTYKLEKFLYYHPQSGVQNKLVGLHKEIFENSFQFMPIEATGYFDHMREIHIPKVKDGVEGYEILSPFFYFDVKDSNIYNLAIADDPKEQVFTESLNSNISIIVNRGWVPKTLKDRRLRPYDNSIEEVKINGKLKFTGTNLHKYTVPNTHYLNIFTNISPIDIYKYWSLYDPLSPKEVYLELIDSNDENSKDVYPIKKTISESVIDETMETGYNYWNKNIERAFGLTALSSVLMGLMCV